MLFRKEQKRKIRAGELTLSFRAWKRPQVRVGGQYNIHPVGAIQVDEIRRTRLSEITPQEASQAGFASLDALAAELTKAPGAASDLYRISFHYLGDALVNQPQAPHTALGREECSELEKRLNGMDARTRDGAWTRAFLDLVAGNPATRAADLAARIGWETTRFKANMRKLKRLGLTESLEVGYRLSARGRSFLAQSACRPRR